MIVLVQNSYPKKNEQICNLNKFLPEFLIFLCFAATEKSDKNSFYNINWIWRCFWKFVFSRVLVEQHL